MEELADCCIKVYTLEKVLLLKKDTLTQTNFMDEAMKVSNFGMSVISMIESFPKVLENKLIVRLNLLSKFVGFLKVIQNVPVASQTRP